MQVEPWVYGAAATGEVAGRGVREARAPLELDQEVHRVPIHRGPLYVGGELYVHPIPPDVQRFSPELLAHHVQAELGALDPTPAGRALGLSRQFTAALLEVERQPSLATYCTLLAHARVPLGSFLVGLSHHPHPRPQPGP